ncbi:hypothetical protein CTA1_10974 [Colletotrichum tanaceti]|uniref:Uncharacterized protein n=1 Tax=Colletotrichum tanaceti TaxID=1306861 RepID=A0A4U6XJW5_9PEZI|nr:hypothetical protein CTA1_10974 [Colletotrichum tanaceti]
MDHITKSVFLIVTIISTWSPASCARGAIPLPAAFVGFSAKIYSTRSTTTSDRLCPASRVPRDRSGLQQQHSAVSIFGLQIASNCGRDEYSSPIAFIHVDYVFGSE